MRLVLLYCAITLLLTGCSKDRLRPETAKCAADANQGESLWYSANASNTASGSLLFTRARNGETALEVWRGCDSSKRVTIPLNVRSPNFLSVSALGQYAIASRWFSSLELLNLESGKSLSYLPDCSGPAELSPDERFVLFTCWGQDVRFFGLAGNTLKPLGSFDPHDSVLAFASDRKFNRLAIGEGNGKIILLDIQKSSDTMDLVNPRTIDEGKGEWVSGLAFSDSSEELYSVSRDGRLDSWNVATGKLVNSWKTELNWVGSVTFFKNATRVVVFGTRNPSGFSDPAAVVIDTTSGRLRSFETNQNGLWGAYIPRSDELFITGFWTVPVIKPGISVIP